VTDGQGWLLLFGVVAALAVQDVMFGIVPVRRQPVPKDKKPWPVVHVDRGMLAQDAGYLTREGVTSACWYCEAEATEHKPGQHNDEWICRVCGTTWSEPHQPTPERTRR